MDSLVNRWIGSGIQHSHTLNVNPARITNVIALICFSVLFLQLPLNIYFWKAGGESKSFLIALHCAGLVLVPLFTYFQRRLYAKLWLVFCYSSYINNSVVLFGAEAQIHNFILLGIFVVPFIFPPKQKLFSILILLLMSLNFLAWETGIFSTPTTDINRQYLDIIIQMNGVSFTLASLLCSIYIIHNINISWKKLANEQQRSEQLLLNILPDSVAQRLKNSPTAVADHFEQVTILFADIKGFSELAKTRTPSQLIELLNDIFSAFDAICHQYGLEKIKTIGDEYMAVAGVPEKSALHAQKACNCALKMQAQFALICKQHKIDSGLRIGLNSGPVVAGVIGTKKFSYDLWGEAVNLASRMESHAKTNKIQLTQNTFELVKTEFSFEPPRLLNVKGFGMTTCHFLIGLKSHATHRRQTIPARKLAETAWSYP